VILVVVVACAAAGVGVRGADRHIIIEQGSEAVHSGRGGSQGGFESGLLDGDFVELAEAEDSWLQPTQHGHVRIPRQQLSRHNYTDTETKREDGNNEQVIYERLKITFVG
jgi:hypothetical protein